MLWPAPFTTRCTRRAVNFAAAALPSPAAITPSESPSSVTAGTAIGGSAASRFANSA